MFSYVIGIIEAFKTETWNQLPIYVNRRYIKHPLQFQNKEALRNQPGQLSNNNFKKNDLRHDIY
jgi:hypothetical protein